MSSLAVPSTISDLSKRAFARRHGVSPSRVTEWVAAGLPLTRDSRVEPEAGDRWVATTLDPNRRAAAKGGHVGKVAGRVADGRAQKLDRENALLDLELARKRGALTDRGETIRALQDFAALQRDAWLGWIARTAPTLVAAGAEPAAVFAALDKAVREHLAELAGREDGNLDRTPLRADADDLQTGERRNHGSRQPLSSEGDGRELWGSQSTR